MRFGVCLVTLLVTAALPSQVMGRSSTTAAVSCTASLVHYTPYPGGAPGLGSLPWIRGTPAAAGLVGLLWYWPTDWRTQAVRGAAIFTGGADPGGHSTKILWAFLSPAAKHAPAAGSLIVKGERLDGPGKSWQRFTSISYSGQNGAPSYASIINVPTPGCWRLRLTTGSLHATAIFAAVAPSG